MNDFDVDGDDDDDDDDGGGGGGGGDRPYHVLAMLVDLAG